MRHVLPILLLLTIPIGHAAARAATQSRTTRAGLAILAVWLMGSSIVAHPDYLPYFNALVPRADHALADDMDWGQDVYRLDQALADVRADSASVFYAGSAPVPQVVKSSVVRCLRLGDRPTGWIAVSRQVLLSPAGRAIEQWLHPAMSVRNVGKSIVLYKMPDDIRSMVRPAAFPHCGIDPWNPDNSWDVWAPLP